MRSSRAVFSTNRRTVRFTPPHHRVRWRGSTGTGTGDRQSEEETWQHPQADAPMTAVLTRCRVSTLRTASTFLRRRVVRVPNRPTTSRSRPTGSSSRRRASSPCSRAGHRSRRFGFGFCPERAQPAGASVRHDRRPDPAAVPARHRGAGVSTTADPARLQGQLPEHQRICRLCFEIKSVAEISALLTIPLGVARILVADLAEAGLVAIHQPGGDESAGGQPDVTLLERVLSGLRKL